MSVLGGLFGSGSDPAADAAAAKRAGKWTLALANDDVPDFVQQRLADARAGKTPWLSTMSPAELLLSRSHGIRPVAMVSGTCWYHYGYSWTTGHAEGWRTALERMKQEALAAGANAVVDVKMRTSNLPVEDSMDFTVIGTAVKIDSLPPSTDPVIATVPAIEFIRLVEEGIVPVGVAVGAHVELMNPYAINPTGAMTWTNQPLGEMSEFWRRVRQRAIWNLRSEARSQGDGVLAHTHFGQLLKIEGGKDSPPRFLGRFMILGTTVHCKRMDNVVQKIRTVVDMRDDLSPLNHQVPHGHNAYPVDSDREGAI
jgi:uncharacterized protein YbjQ (UPF0145 family)